MISGKAIALTVNHAGQKPRLGYPLCNAASSKLRIRSESATSCIIDSYACHHTAQPLCPCLLKYLLHGLSAVLAKMEEFHLAEDPAVQLRFERLRITVGDYGT